MCHAPVSLVTAGNKCFFKARLTVKSQEFNSRTALTANILFSVGMLHSRTPPTSEVLAKKKQIEKLVSLFEGSVSGLR